MPPIPPGPRTPDMAVDIHDFPGLMSNRDPHDIPPGAAIAQVNCVPIRPGELRVRPGAALVKFDG